MPDIAKEEVIYQAAKELFLKLGYKKTTMKKISDRAGISHGLISYYYKKKDFIERLFKDYIEKIDAAITRDVGNLLENSFQRYVLLGKINTNILYNSSPESIRLHKELANNNMLPDSMHNAFRNLLKASVQEFGCHLRDDQFYMLCEVEFHAKVKISSDIHSGKMFLDETSASDFLSGIVLKLAGVPHDIVEENVRKANELFSLVDYSDIDLFS